jgi:hypothetical protein
LHPYTPTHAELKLENFVKQRRRWNNGTAAGYFFLVRDCWSKIWLDGKSTHRLPICYFCWPMWQISVTIMVFCELFKYLVVCFTPSIFIIGLHLALSQSWLFGAGTDDARLATTATVGQLSTTNNNNDNFQDARLAQFVYVEGFTVSYVLLYVYFAISHCKDKDPQKDRSFQGWTFMLAILSNALIMCFSFTGIAISVHEGVISFGNDWAASAGHEASEPANIQAIINDINARFRQDPTAGMGVGLNLEESISLSQAGLVTHQFDSLNKKGMPWMPCMGDECHSVAELVITLADQSTQYDLGHYEGGFSSSCLINKGISKLAK